MNHFADEGMAELACLAVDPEWAGEGYGETLLPWKPGGHRMWLRC